MARSPEEIQREINNAREALAGTLDQLVERANPKRIVDNGKRSVRGFFESPKGKVVLAAAGGLVAMLIARRINLAVKNHRNND